MKALSIRQPWAWLIVHGGKDIENRTWKTNYRGPVLIHASKTFEGVGMVELIMGVPLPSVFARGGIIGMADLVDCVTESDSRWFAGPFGFVLQNARPLPFKAVRGRLGLFEAEATSYEVTER